MKTIKSFSIVAVMLILAGSVKAQELQYTITGKLQNFSPMPAKIYLFELVHTGVLAKSLDSSEVINGEYHFSGKFLADQATQVMIGTGNSVKSEAPYFILMVDKGDIQLLSDGSIKKSTVTGTGAAAQHQFEEIMAPTMALIDSINVEKDAGDFANDKEFKKRILGRVSKVQVVMLTSMYNYVKKYPDARVTPYTRYSLICVDYLQQPSRDTLMATIPENTLNGPLQQLTIAEDKHHKVMIDSLTKIAEAKNSSKLKIGTKALDFTQNDTKGNPVSLSSFKGKYILVDFWASWCAPCRAENPNVVKAYQKYKDKGFTVLGVSLDAQAGKAAWLKAIEKDGLTWTQVSDLEGWKNGAAQLYDIRSIPQNFLVDPNGMIVGKNLRGEALNAKLAELFK